jgi:hypothetical protein
MERRSSRVGTSTRDRVTEANEQAFRRLLDADPVLIDVRQAKDAVPGMTERTILHAGPPVEWNRMSPCLKHGVIGGVLYEDWAQTPDEVERLVKGGDVLVEPCHEHSAVGSMAGIVTPSMWVYEVEERRSKGRAYCGVYEGRGKTLAFGSYEQGTIDRLRWMESVLGPALQRAVGTLDDGLPLKPIIAKALHMGDECHNRYVASTLLYVDELAKALLVLDITCSEVEAILRFLTDEHYNSFLTLSMAGCKAMADAAHGVEYSTMVTAMARNGTDFGIRVSGLGETWFTAPAQMVEGLYFPGHGAAEADLDIGDSSITETVGLGGFALLAAPVTMQVVGKGIDEAVRLEQEMSEITLGRNEAFTLPYLDFQGTPTGVDVLKVVETNVTPVCVTAMASTSPNVGMIGAGVVRQPVQCFESALRAFAERYRGAKPAE